MEESFRGIHWGYKIERDKINLSINSDILDVNSKFNGAFKIDWNKENENAELKLNGDIGFKSKLQISDNWQYEFNPECDFTKFEEFTLSKILDWAETDVKELLQEMYG